MERRPASRQYENLGIIGMGSFCTVFKVQNRESKRLYALKKSSTVLRTKDSLSEALSEVRIIKHLHGESTDHSTSTSAKTADPKTGSGVNHIAEFSDHWLSRQGQLHQLYSYYGHGTLQDLTDFNERFTELQMLEVFRQICVGVDYIHSKGVIHLDLKPSNIFVDDDLTIKIGDFGISVNVKDEKSSGHDWDSSKTPKAAASWGLELSPGKECKFRCSGDPIYIAPELMQFSQSLNDIDYKTDVFSLGIILVELLCDCNMPSQGPVSQNLRQNGAIDFSLLAPSLAESAETPPVNDIGFSLIRQIIKPQTASTKKAKRQKRTVAMSIDHDIKAMIRSMLKKEVADRKSAAEIIAAIDQIRLHDAYCEFFSHCPGIKELNLPPVDVDVVVNTIQPRYTPRRAAGLLRSESDGVLMPSEPVTGDRKRCSLGFYEDEGAPSTFYWESPITLDAMLRRECSEERESRRQSFLFSPSPNKPQADNRLQLNLSTMFDSAYDFKTPTERKTKNADPRSSLSIHSLFQDLSPTPTPQRFGTVTPIQQIMFGHSDQKEENSEDGWSEELSDQVSDLLLTPSFDVIQSDSGNGDENEDSDIYGGPLLNAEEEVETEEEGETEEEEESAEQEEVEEVESGRDEQESEHTEEEPNHSSYGTVARPSFLSRLKKRLEF